MSERKPVEMSGMHYEVLRILRDAAEMVGSVYQPGLAVASGQVPEVDQMHRDFLMLRVHAAALIAQGEAMRAACDQGLEALRVVNRELEDVP